MSTNETPLKLEHEQVIENLLPALQELIALVPANHRASTRTMADAILQNLQRANVGTNIVGPVLAMALDRIMSAVLERSRDLRATGAVHPSDPKDVS